MDVFSFRVVPADDRGIADDVDGRKVDDLANELYEAGCDDGSPGLYSGELDVTLHTEPEKMMDAIRSTLEPVESIGCRVLKVVSPHQPVFDPVNEELTNRSRSAVASDR